MHGGYNAYERNGVFIKPNGDDTHQRWRSKAGHYFARLSNQWKLVSGIYSSKNTMHATHVRKIVLFSQI